MDETPEEIAGRLRGSTEAMANLCSVDMTLWDRHSRAALTAADALDRQAAEITRLRSIIGDTVWCEACGSVVLLDGPPHCDCIEYGNPESQRLRAHDAGAQARVAEQAAEIERLRSLTTWRPIAEAPRDGTPIVGAETYRYQPYKPDGRRQMRSAGRWQRATEYGWHNDNPPAAWMPADALPPSTVSGED